MRVALTHRHAGRQRPGAHRRRHVRVRQGRRLGEQPGAHQERPHQPGALPARREALEGEAQHQHLSGRRRAGQEPRAQRRPGVAQHVRAPARRRQHVGDAHRIGPERPVVQRRGGQVREQAARRALHLERGRPRGDGRPQDIREEELILRAARRERGHGAPPRQQQVPAPGDERAQGVLFGPRQPRAPHAAAPGGPVHQPVAGGRHEPRRHGVARRAVEGHRRLGERRAVLAQVAAVVHRLQEDAHRGRQVVGVQRFSAGHRRVQPLVRVDEQHGRGGAHAHAHRGGRERLTARVHRGDAEVAHRAFGQRDGGLGALHRRALVPGPAVRALIEAVARRRVAALLRRDLRRRGPLHLHRARRRVARRHRARGLRRQVRGHAVAGREVLDEPLHDGARGHVAHAGLLERRRVRRVVVVRHLQQHAGHLRVVRGVHLAQVRRAQGAHAPGGIHLALEVRLQLREQRTRHHVAALHAREVEGAVHRVRPVDVGLRAPDVAGRARVGVPRHVDGVLALFVQPRGEARPGRHVRVALVGQRVRPRRGVHAEGRPAVLHVVARALLEAGARERPLRRVPHQAPAAAQPHRVHRQRRARAGRRVVLEQHRARLRVLARLEEEAAQQHPRPAVAPLVHAEVALPARVLHHVVRVRRARRVRAIGDIDVVGRVRRHVRGPRRRRGDGGRRVQRARGAQRERLHVVAHGHRRSPPPLLFGGVEAARIARFRVARLSVVHDGEQRVQVRLPHRHHRGARAHQQGQQLLGHHLHGDEVLHHAPAVGPLRRPALQPVVPVEAVSGAQVDDLAGQRALAQPRLRHARHLHPDAGLRVARLAPHHRRLLGGQPALLVRPGPRGWQIVNTGRLQAQVIPLEGRRDGSGGALRSREDTGEEQGQRQGARPGREGGSHHPADLTRSLRSGNRTRGC
ncbi:hypothetical protein COSO111634_14100 [Corallococcus soli]